MNSHMRARTTYNMVSRAALVWAGFFLAILKSATCIGGTTCESGLQATPQESICTVLNKSAEEWYQQNGYKQMKRHLSPKIHMNKSDIPVTGGWTFYANCLTKSEAQKGTLRVGVSPFYRTYDDCIETEEDVRDCVASKQISVGETVLLDGRCIRETIRADMPSRTGAEPVLGRLRNH
jgi:hypothetical protein